MFIVRFKGGLGNQMFQYAFFHSLEKIFGKRTKILADLTNYRLDKYHNGYELKKVFGIKIPEASDDEIRHLSGHNPPNNIYSKIKSKLSRILSTSAKATKKNIISIPSLRPEENYVKKKWQYFSELNEGYFDGYWQNEEWYEPIEDEIPHIFSFRNLSGKDMEFAKKIKGQQSVFVHIRRGDYLGSKFDVLSDMYYRNSIEELLKIVDYPFFYFFSDDIEYVRNVFGNLKIEKFIVSNNRKSNSYKDMFFMSCCKHAIIANSSFSYWAAKIGKQRKQIVIAPSKFSKTYQFPLADSHWSIFDAERGIRIK